ncbi:MAG TPA: DUF2752 domain-containing protein [Verrucomicrobiae bacterium]|nr:DUF2752 domain-containing protein [Verrucomicrobiae bacterium]
MVTRVKMIGLGVAFGLVAAVLFAFDPTRVNIYPVCAFHQLTGLWCPGCGTTRALHQLLHGNVVAAFHFNALSMAMLPVAGYLIVRGDVTTLKPGWIWVLLAVIVAFGVLRNIPVYPCTLLAP